MSPTRAPTTVSLSPARVPDVDPIDAAAHLQLLGESLSLIGHRLQETEVSRCARIEIPYFHDKLPAKIRRALAELHVFISCEKWK